MWLPAAARGLKIGVRIDNFKCCATIKSLSINGKKSADLNEQPILSATMDTFSKYRQKIKSMIIINH